MSKKIGEYKLVNPDKVDRAINGVTNDNTGDLIGGVGEDASDEMMLAAYDRLGGLIKNKNGDNIKSGCFCDYKESKKQSRLQKKVVVVPIEEPKVILEFRTAVLEQGRIVNQVVEISEDKPIPMKVKVALKAQEQIKATK